MDNKIDIEKILDEADDLLDAYKYDQAIAKYNYILERVSNCADALLMRGALLGEQGKIDSAIIDIEKSIAIDSRNDSSFLTLAYLYNRKNNDKKVVELCQVALELKPDNTEAMNLLLRTCKKLGDNFTNEYFFDAAKHYFDIALKYKKDDLGILYGRALAARGNGEIKECIEFSERAIQFDPNNFRNKAHIAALYEILGEVDKGNKLIQELYQENNDHPFVRIIYAKYALRTKKQEEGIAVLEKLLLRENEMQQCDLIDAKRLLGDLYDSTKQYDSAFEYYKQSNDLVKGNYNPSVYRDYISGLINYFSKEKYSSLPTSTCSSDELIFIIGMPRSGTSLIEQIISSHSDVFGAGELTHVDNFVGMIGGEILKSTYPRCLDKANLDIFNEIADKLLSEIRKEKSSEAGEVRITDKMPHNFHHIGILHKLFPNAKFIHCSRDPRDTCLSCYFQNFAGSHPYANDLHALGFHYLEHERLMRHWTNELAIPVLTVSYEAVVEDTRSEIEKILSFLELDWEESCMEFYKQKRKVTTASYNQVNKNIYNSSVGRWLNYKENLSELITTLGDRSTHI